jgi:hypothetical protein
MSVGNFGVGNMGVVAPCCAIAGPPINSAAQIHRPNFMRRLYQMTNERITRDRQMRISMKA